MDHTSQNSALSFLTNEANIFTPTQQSDTSEASMRLYLLKQRLRDQQIAGEAARLALRKGACYDIVIAAGSAGVVAILAYVALAVRWGIL